MTDELPVAPERQSPEPGPHPLTPAAQRARAEAETRRQARAAVSQDAPAETGGRTGPDPVRYGDWEKGGIASDF